MYIYLDFLTGFSCEKCGTCCRNDWQITVDEATFRRNAQMFARLGQEAVFLSAFIPIKNGGGLGEYAYIAKQQNGACWFLDTNQLCSLQKEVGHDHLDAVCQTYPRYPMNSARGCELTLSLSCPAVLHLISQRSAPLAVIRSDQPPISFNLTNYVVEIHPQQKAAQDPLRYYFELEHHFIDILQWRSLLLSERLELFRRTIEALAGIDHTANIGNGLNNIINANYNYLLGLPSQTGRTNLSDREVLVEHFLVNFVFKKPLFIYGLQPGFALLEACWRQIQHTEAQTVDQDGEMGRLQTSIQKLEFLYTHHRQALFTDKGAALSVRRA